VRRSTSSIPSLVASLVAVLVLGAPVSSVDAQGNARTLTREAVREFDRGNYAEARALFLQAYDAQPSARLLRGAGMASFELREYVVAHRQLREALAETRRALTPRQRRETEELLGRTDTFLGRFRLRIEPADAEVTIDLRAPEPEEDGTLLLAVGDHTITARAEGFVPVDRRFAVRGGELEDLTVVLARDEPPNADALVSPRPEPVVVEPPRETGLDALGIGLVSAGGALVVAAVVDVFWWVDRRQEVSRCEEAEATPGASCLNLGTLRRQSRAAAATTFLVGAAGLAMATVGILRLTWDDENDEVACGLGGCTYRLRF
jgi:hypothetical protein